MENSQKNISGTWENIFSNFDENKLILDEIMKGLKKEFLKEFLRIKAVYKFPLYNDVDKAVTNFIDDIPDKLSRLNIQARLYKKHYFSCIITDEEIDLLAGIEHQKLVNEIDTQGREYGDSPEEEAKVDPDLKPFSDLDLIKQRFYRKLIYTIPVIFVRCGYELFRPAEEEFRNIEQLKNLARVIHARYCTLIKNMNEESIKKSLYEKLAIVNNKNRKNFNISYDDLPDDIKSSSIDSAYHIATKLLSIGYAIKEENNEAEQILLYLSKSDIETMAKLEHERWAWEKRLSGWTYAPERNNKNKKHNCLVPYDELTELEKEKDRDQVKLYPALLKAINYKIIPLSPEQSRNISYIPQQKKLLDETILKIEVVKEQLVEKTQKINENLNIKNIKDQLSYIIKDLSTAVDSFNMAAGIQHNILPSKIYFKICLPESFILFKPKDILSGD
ncbi:MAG: hypothetical protein KAR07_06605, partial [Spirochaetes bacterium]|nr:hypothetical protein [Spirochaetota bacterium]